MSVELSVCIATWCRKEYLAEIINKLENQSLSQDKYEIIVCDSFSNDGTRELMEEVCGRYSNIRYINTHKNILATKRNISIEAALAPIVIFMDDDVFPTYNFLEAHLNAHKLSNNIVYCGQIRFPENWVKASNYYRYRDECHINKKYKHDLNNLPFNNIVVMNMSFKKDEIIKKVGMVCEDFIGYGGEDIEFGYRICQAGMKLVYLDEALAYHYEMSESIIKYGEKIFRAGRDGERILNIVNKEILNQTKLNYFNKNNSKDNYYFKFKANILNILTNKIFKKLVETFLIKTDKNKFLYNKILYRYYIACKFKEGKLAQSKNKLSVEDVKNGWYN